MLKRLSLEEAHGLWRPLVYNLWIACVCSHFFVTSVVFSLQRAYKQYVLECLARYSVEKMPYAILPREYPSGHRKVFKSLFFQWINWFYSRGPTSLTVIISIFFELCWQTVLLSSGGDTSCVEQARYWKLSPSVDHHLGHFGWSAASGSTNLRPIQGQWIKAFKTLVNCLNVQWKIDRN